MERATPAASAVGTGHGFELSRRSFLLPLDFFADGLGATTSWNGTDLILDIP